MNILNIQSLSTLLAPFNVSISSYKSRNLPKIILKFDVSSPSTWVIIKHIFDETGMLLVSDSNNSEHVYTVYKKPTNKRINDFLHSYYFWHVYGILGKELNNFINLNNFRTNNNAIQFLDINNDTHPGILATASKLLGDKFDVSFKDYEYTLHTGEQRSISMVLTVGYDKLMYA